jgi:hypothetical protein
VRRQRGQFVVRIDGIDTATGKPRPKQIGTYPSQRAARDAAARAAAEATQPAARGTLGWLVNRWVTSRTDVGPKTRAQYEWAATHIQQGLGAVSLESLDRDDVAQWLDGLATGGQFSRRSVQIFRMVLRAVLADAATARRGRVRRFGLVQRAPLGVQCGYGLESRLDGRVRRMASGYGV